MKRTTMVCVGMLCVMSGLRGQAAEDAESLLNQAWHKFSVQEETNAVALFEQVLAANPKPPIKAKALIGLGKCQQALRQHEEALATWERVKQECKGYDKEIKEAQAASDSLLAPYAGYGRCMAKLLSSQTLTNNTMAQVQMMRNLADMGEASVGMEQLLPVRGLLTMMESFFAEAGIRLRQDKESREQFNKHCTEFAEQLNGPHDNRMQFGQDTNKNMMVMQASSNVIQFAKNIGSLVREEDKAKGAPLFDRIKPLLVEEDEPEGKK